MVEGDGGVGRGGRVEGVGGKDTTAKMFLQEILAKHNTAMVLREVCITI